ncbi:unnamed protein product [Lactuca virosa]|uniref:Uncharacterized protein n=1 Tax=Lactuca virosa TaxID=75947 RepID=A0AAU9MA26_9ASTR|nr:unnamed protein product [Lactuca virosa]
MKQAKQLLCFFSLPLPKFLVCRIISDLYGNGSQFPDLSNMTDMENFFVCILSTLVFSEVSGIQTQTGTLLQNEQKIEFDVVDISW